VPSGSFRLLGERSGKTTRPDDHGHHHPDRGEVHLFSRLRQRDGRRIGYLLKSAASAGDGRAALFLGELNRWHARAKSPQRCERSARRVGEGQTLSKGCSRLVGTVLRAGTADPHEPFSASTRSTKLFRDLIVSSNGGRTIIFSTHVMEHAEKLCGDRWSPAGECDPGELRRSSAARSRPSKQSSNGRPAISRSRVSSGETARFELEPGPRQPLVAALVGAACPSRLPFAEPISSRSSSGSHHANRTGGDDRPPREPDASEQGFWIATSLLPLARRRSSSANCW
jgi:hypothetical protein